jgi:3-hydroxy-3-methylglutaryl CoA synthase
MAGITSYGAYIPRYRMNRKVIFDQFGWFNPANASVARGEKAVANYDEDTVTMAVAAATDCLNGRDRKKVDAVYLASVSLPFAERQNAVIVSDALNCSSKLRTADFGGSLRSGTTALLSALDAADAGGNIMVCAADSRLGKPGSPQEYTFGDGAAALLVGNDGVVAEFKGSFSVSRDFIDYRRLPGEKFGHEWEARWIRDEGYGKIIPEAAFGLLRNYGLDIKDFAKIIIACPVQAAFVGLVKTLGAKPEQIQDNMMSNVGDSGSALPLMMFVAALEEAKPGDKIMVISYGNGSDAIYFEVTDEIEKIKKGRKGIKGCLSEKEALSVYGKYLVFKNIIPVEAGIRGEEIPPTAMSVLWREGRTISALVGSRCKVCGTPQYPRHRVCVNPDCGAVDQMEDYHFSDKTGTVNSYTGDSLAFCWDPPQIYGSVDFEDGGRIFLEFTDCELASLKVGMPVFMSFRRKYADPHRGHYGYFWKAVPVK